MRVVVTGGTGFVGRFIVEALLDRNYDVIVTGRARPERGFFSQPVKFEQAPLDPESNYSKLFKGADGFVHCAFHHAPGRYRGGEGDDVEGFVRKNFGGTMAMVKHAREMGVKRMVFMSTRAVYGAQEPGVELYENMTPNPDTLYGKIKYEMEQVIQELSCDDFIGTSLRVTGVYGQAAAGQDNKWSQLFRDYISGAAIEPRVATEVHGEDVARAVMNIMHSEPHEVSGQVFNVSDIVVDRRDILGPLKSKAGLEHDLPEPGNRDSFNAMDCDKLRELGWRTGGVVKLSMTLDSLVSEALKELPTPDKDYGT